MHMAKSKKLSIADDHYIDLAEAAGVKPTIDVYGKVVRNATIDSTTTGLVHPSGEDENLHLAQVVGLSERGRNITLAHPQLVALPAPDGPAEGSDWDPKKYVVWKNLPKNWTTLHLQATTRGLHSALTSFGAAAPAKPCLQLPAAVQLVRSCSKADPDLPLSTPLNQVLPSQAQRTSFCQCVADGVPIDRSEIPCGATNTLQDVVDAITCK